MKIIKGSYPGVDASYSKQLRDLIAKMLNHNPKERPTIVDILNRPFIKNKVITYIYEMLSGNHPNAQNAETHDEVTNSLSRFSAY